MLLQHRDLTIRSALPADAQLLADWWNDGAVMAHAGFPKGLGISPELVALSLEADADDTHRRLILEKDGVPIGEMNYRSRGNRTAEIGIKICNPAFQNRGLGRRLLSMLIYALFHDLGYRKIILDTNLKNTRAQHVYEMLGFQRLRVRENAWKDQLGELQSAVDYELLPENFRNCAG